MDDIFEEIKQEQADCKIIERVIEVRTIIPDDLCNICFKSCLSSGWNSTSTAFSSAMNYTSAILYTYSPHVLTFLAGSAITALFLNRHALLKPSLSTIVLTALNPDNENIVKALTPNESFIKNMSPMSTNDYEHMTSQVPIDNFISASDYSNMNYSPLENMSELSFTDKEINLDITND